MKGIPNLVKLLKQVSKSGTMERALQRAESLMSKFISKGAKTAGKTGIPKAGTAVKNVKNELMVLGDRALIRASEKVPTVMSKLSKYSKMIKLIGGGAALTAGAGALAAYLSDRTGDDEAGKLAEEDVVNQNTTPDGFFGNLGDESFDRNSLIDERIRSFLIKYKTIPGSLGERLVNYDPTDDARISVMSARDKARLLNHYVSRICHIIRNTDSTPLANLLQLIVFDSVVLDEGPKMLSEMTGRIIDRSKKVDSSSLTLATNASLQEMIAIRFKQRAVALSLLTSDRLTKLSGLVESGVDITDLIPELAAEEPIQALVSSAFPSANYGSASEVSAYLASTEGEKADSDDTQDKAESDVIALGIAMAHLAPDETMQQDYNNELVYPFYDNRLNYN